MQDYKVVIMKDNLSSSFKEAVKVAIENAKSLLGNIKDIELEGVLVDRNYYRVSISYEIAQNKEFCKNQTNVQMRTLVDLLSKRREVKTFLVKKRSFEFAGFKNSEE